MKRPWVWFALAVQLGLLVWMAAHREWILAEGETLWLRTAPVDPRDIFRGDYVELDYDISVLAPAQLSSDLREGERRLGERIYVTLSTGTDGLAKAVQASRTKPTEGLFLAGRISRNWRIASSQAIPAKYGIEKYFVEQGSGWEMEERRGRRDEVQVPMEVAIALSPNGTAVLKEHRWSRLGIGLRRLESPPGETLNQAPQTPVQTNTAPVPADSRFELTLKNVSSAPLTLALLPDDCSFRIASVGWAERAITLHQEGCRDPDPASARLLTLAPEEAHQLEFDFTNDERWWLPQGEGHITIAALDWSQQFRIHYEPPLMDGLTPQVWQGSLPSPAFHGGGQID